MHIAMFLSVLAAVLVCGAYIPYAIDIIRGRVIPSRSARLMLTLLIVIALFQQWGLKAGWTMAVTAGETIGSLAILALAFRKGIGGLKRLDQICYVLLIIDLFLWLTSKQTLLALHLTILADTIAVYPTLVKTWRQPSTETPLFYIAGIVAPLLSILAEGRYTYTVVLFPLYLALINTLVLILIYKRPAGLSGGILAV